MNFRGNPMVKNLPSHAGGVGWILGEGAKILHASWPKNQMWSRSNIVTKSIKTLKMIHNNNKKALKKYCQALRDLISVHLYNFMFYPLFCIHAALLAIPKLWSFLLPQAFILVIFLPWKLFPWHLYDSSFSFSHFELSPLLRDHSWSL